LVGNAPGPYADVYFLPKDYVWGLQDVYEVMKVCENSKILRGVYPCSASEGGFEWADKEYRHHHVGVQIRIGNGPGRLPYCGTDSSWKTEIPKRMNNFADSKRKRPGNSVIICPNGADLENWEEHVSVMTLDARGVSLRMLWEVAKILKSFGHHIIGTSGFRVKNSLEMAGLKHVATDTAVIYQVKELVKQSEFVAEIEAEITEGEQHTMYANELQRLVETLVAKYKSQNQPNGRYYNHY